MKFDFTRWQQAAIMRALKEWRVVLLAGARQVGKTHLVKQIRDSTAHPPSGNEADATRFFDFDDRDTIAVARDDPKAFVAHDQSLFIIDEAQRYPDLLYAVKQNVDNDHRKGRFLLTGSSMIDASGILVGRTDSIRLRPLTVGERKNRAPDFISKIFARKISKADLQNTNDTDDKSSYLTHALNGGFPEALARKTASAKRDWHRKYIDGILNKDLRQVAPVRLRSDMEKIAEVLAEASAQPINIDKLLSPLAMKRETFMNYSEGLASLFFIERVPPWTTTNGFRRVTQHNKMFLTDSGVMATLTGMRLNTLQRNITASGKLMETFVFNELSALLECQQSHYKLYHFRDRDGHEIDFVIEGEGDLLVGIEVKASSSLQPEDFKNLKWFGKHIARPRKFRGIILHSGEHVFSRGNDFWSMPFNCMWG